MIMINPSLEHKKLSRVFLESRKVVISNFLKNSSAEKIYKSIDYVQKNNLWYQAVRGDPNFYNAKNSSHSAHFSYRYSKFPISNISLQSLVGGAKGDSRRSNIQNVMDYGSNPEEELPAKHPLLKVRSLLTSNACNHLIQNITGLKLKPSMTIASLTKFSSGDILTTHDDGVVAANSRRLIAFVYCLTKGWHSHWGGQTMFPNTTQSDFTESKTPQFNSILLFEVPVLHFIAPISIYCPLDRICISGWFLGD